MKAKQQQMCSFELHCIIKTLQKSTLVANLKLLACHLPLPILHIPEVGGSGNWDSNVSLMKSSTITNGPFVRHNINTFLTLGINS